MEGCSRGITGIVVGMGKNVGQIRGNRKVGK